MRWATGLALLGVFSLGGTMPAKTSERTASSSRQPAPIVVDGKGVPAPRLLKRVEPTYPAAERRKGRALPRIFVELLIDEEGHVTSTRLLTTTDATLTPYVLAAIRKWRYAPTIIHGRPVSVRFNLMFWHEVR